MGMATFLALVAVVVHMLMFMPHHMMHFRFIQKTVFVAIFLVEHQFVVFDEFFSADPAVFVGVDG